MPDPAEPTPPASDPLDAIIAAYIEQVEAAEVPDRDALLARHPELADQLRAFFADYDRLDLQAAELRLTVRDEPIGDAASPINGRPRVPYFGDYELLEVIARGGMGVVYKARQMSLNRVVALKMILQGEIAGPTDVARFRAEAEAAANLDHPHIVPIYEVGEHQGQQYYAMKFVEGTPLTDHPRGDARSAAMLVGTVARAVHHAHQRGILHRDLKPSNILVDTTGTALVADFGLAKRMAGAGQYAGYATVSGAIIGTPRYMTPEQAAGRKDLTVATDIYSLGVVLYERLTGRTPFSGGSVLEILRQVREAEPPRPSSLVLGLDRDLETVCLKCLEKDPSIRYGSAEELGDELDRWLRGEPILARPVGQAERAWRWCRRNQAVAGLLAAVALALLIGISFSTFFAIRARGQAREALQAQEQAQVSESRANAHAEEARTNADRAESERQRANAGAERARRNLYVAHVNLAQAAWREARIERVLELLEPYRRPDPGGTDLREFEWHYLQRLCGLDFRTLGEESPKLFGFVDPNVAFSPDGRWLASARRDHSVTLWDVGTGKVRLTLGKSGQMKTAVAFSPDGKLLAAGSHDRTIRVWDVTSGEEVMSFFGHTSPVVNVTFSPDGKRLASASLSIALGGRGEVKLWDIASRQVVLTLHGEGEYDRLANVLFSPDGRRIATGSWLGGTVTVWDANDGRKLFTQKGFSPVSPTARGVAFSPDGSRVAFTGKGHTVCVWEPATGTVPLTLYGHSGYVSGVTFSSDGKRIASCGWDLTARVWDASTGEELLTLRGHQGSKNEGIGCVSFSPDGWRLATVSRSGTVKIWDACTPLEDFKIQGHTGRLAAVAFSPDGRCLGSAGYDRTARIWETATGRILRTLRGHSARVRDLAFSPDGRMIATAGDRGIIKIWDTDTGKELLELDDSDRRGRLVHGQIWSVAFSPDGRYLTTGHGSGALAVWDFRAKRRVLSLSGHTMLVRSIAISPSGRQLASASWDRTIKIWDLTTGKEVQTFRGHTSAVNKILYSPDGRTIISASDDRTIRFWDTFTGRETRSLSGHAGTVRGLAMGPGSKRLVSGGGDGVKVWDLTTGQELLTLPCRGGDYSCVAYSPDGSRIALASSTERRIRLFDASPTTPSSKEQLEAIALVRFLFAKELPPADVLSRIREDTTISDPVRQHALAVAEHWQQDVDTEALDDACWAVLRQANADAAPGRAALRQAETICRLEPERGDYLTTLGVAQYRTGQYAEALKTLTRAHELDANSEELSVPACIAFLAMTRHRLGDRQEACETLDRLREMIRQPEWPFREYAKPFLEEAEALVAGHPVGDPK